MAIVTEGTYAIGDWIWVGEDEGEVVSISRRTTKIRTRSSDIVTIPNSLVTTGKVRNESRPTPVHAEFVYVSAAYDAPPNRVRDVLRRGGARGAEGAARRRRRCSASHKFGGLGRRLPGEALDHRHRAASPTSGPTCCVQIWYHFQREGIEIPYPVREVRRRAAAARRPRGASAQAVLARLRTVPFFAALPEDLLERCSRGTRASSTTARASASCQQGEAGDTCYVVDAGSGSRSSSRTGARPSGRSPSSSAGDLFGEMSLLTGEPRTRDRPRARRLPARGGRLVGASRRRSSALRTSRIRLAEVATLRKEGLLEARAALDAAGARARGRRAGAAPGRA